MPTFVHKAPAPRRRVAPTTKTTTTTTTTLTMMTTVAVVDLVATEVESSADRARLPWNIEFSDDESDTENRVSVRFWPTLSSSNERTIYVREFADSVNRARSFHRRVSLTEFVYRVALGKCHVWLSLVVEKSFMCAFTRGTFHQSRWSLKYSAELYKVCSRICKSSRIFRFAYLILDFNLSLSRCVIVKKSENANCSFEKTFRFLHYVKWIV